MANRSLKKIDQFIAKWVLTNRGTEPKALAEARKIQEKELKQLERLRLREAKIILELQENKNRLGWLEIIVTNLEKQTKASS